MSGWTHVTSKKRNAAAKAATEESDQAHAAAAAAAARKTTIYGQMAALEEAKKAEEAKKSRAERLAMMSTEEKKRLRAAERKAAAKERERKKKAKAKALAALEELAVVLPRIDVRDMVTAAVAEHPGNFLAQGMVLTEALEAALAGSRPMARLALSAKLSEEQMLDAIAGPLGKCTTSRARKAVAVLDKWAQSGVSELPSVVDLFDKLARHVIDHPTMRGHASSWNGSRLLLQLLARNYPIVLPFTTGNLSQMLVGKNRKNLSTELGEALWIASQFDALGALGLIGFPAAVPATSGLAWPRLAAFVLTAVARRKPAALHDPARVSSLAGSDLATLQTGIGALFKGATSQAPRLTPEVTASLLAGLARHTAGDNAFAATLLDEVVPYTTHQAEAARVAALAAAQGVLTANPDGLMAYFQTNYGAKVAAMANLLTAVHQRLFDLADGAELGLDAGAVRNLADFVVVSNDRLLTRSSLPAQLSVADIELTPSIITVCTTNATAVVAALDEFEAHGCVHSSGSPVAAAGSSSGARRTASPELTLGWLLRTVFSVAQSAAVLSISYVVGVAGAATAVSMAKQYVAQLE